MGDSRREILGRLKSRADGPPLPPAWVSRREFVDLAERFAASLRKAHGEVYRVGSWAEVVGQVDVILRELQVERAVMNDEVPLDGLAVRERWPAIEWCVAGEDGGLREACAAADVGLSGVAAALAETGSLVIMSGAGLGRLVTLLPPVHLALVSVSQLMVDVLAWVGSRPGRLPANVVFVSGPSKTGDIEQTLSVGVHGPKRLIVVLYDG